MTYKDRLSFHFHIPTKIVFGAGSLKEAVKEMDGLQMKKALVVTGPGREFGAEGHLRLSFCGTVKEIMEGVARIKWALDPESPNEIYIGDRKMRRDWK